MMKSVRLLLVVFACAVVHQSFGTHIRAGEIRLDRLSCSQLSYRITLIVYTNTLSPSHPGGTIGGGTLSWGEGSMQLPQINDVTIIDAALHIGRVTFIKDITFTREGIFKISYEEAHRNVSTLNIPNSSDNIDFYVEDLINVSSSFCDSSPSFLVPPIDQACKGMSFYHNPGATDADGDSLSFSLVIPKGTGGFEIFGYADPNDPKFYTGLNYQTANMDKNGPPTFAINATTGLLTWDAPGFTGAYNIAIKVTQWKKNPADSTWLQFGYVVRDMQIEVLDCTNHPPDLSASQNICILAGELANIEIKGTDQDRDPVTMEIFSDITSFTESAAMVKYAGLLQSTAADTAHLKISWRPDCLRVRDQPYQVVIKITDHPSGPGGVSLTRFRSFYIRVMGPAPVISKIQVNPAVKKVLLQWNAYTCQNAESIQVWRRVAKKNYNQSHCEVGMPKSLQYQLIAELPFGTATYEDHDLAIGAQYCYRIVARFKDVASKISLDTCLIPQPAKAPVITNVSVAKTDSNKGEIRISWRSPYDIDKSQYPPPYNYLVQRGNSFEGGEWTTITSQNISDTTFLDTTVPTVDTAYHYRIQLYVPSLSSASVDTSSVASSVRLKAKASAKNIQLKWDAKVPWSNYLQTFPYHYIYRKEVSDVNFILIDSVAVSDNGLLYIDQGKYANQPLNDHKIYSYYVTTTGGYGNPKIKEPLINNSQVVTLHLIDTIPPCPPVVKILSPDCGSLPCAATYTNTVKWYTDFTKGCQDDVVYYEVYVSDTPAETFSLWVNHQEDSVIVQPGLKDLSKCYKVIAVDWVGNRSKMSEMACGENCPVFNMPNVFTPDSSPGFNDAFRAFGPIGNLFNKECSRFVDFMALRVINRWGKEVFASSSYTIDNVYWDGKDRSGNELPTGVYYFLADVVLNYSSLKKENLQVKGWVQLVR